MYIDLKSVRSWETTLTPRSEGRYSALTLVSGAVYRVKIGSYEITFHEDMKGSKIFTLFFEGTILEDERIPLGAARQDYMKTLSEFARWGEDLEWEERNPERGRVIFTGDYPSA